MRARSIFTSLAIAASASVLLHATPAAAAVMWDESVSGDLSGDRFNPTALTISQGVNSLLATSMTGDREYVTFNLAAGLQLQSITVVSFVGNDPLAFIAVQSGATFTEPPTGTNVANLLGYSHFGTGNGTLGTDILDNMGVGMGAIGFTPPLPGGGNYAFWIQQTGPNPVTYQLDFVVGVPGPAGLPLLALAGLMGTSSRRRAAG